MELEEEKLIHSKKHLWIGVALLLLGTIIVLPYPYNFSLGETVMLAIGIPVYSNMETLSGFHFVGIAALIIFIAGLSYIVSSLNKWRGRILIFLLFFLPVLPNMIVETIQSSFATGVYAVSYKSEQSQCSYLLEEGTAEAKVECTISLENHRNKTVEFEVVFLDSRFDEVETSSLLNKRGPYYFTLQPRENKTYHFEEVIDVSGIDHYNYMSSSSNINIILRDDRGKERRL